MKHMNKILTVSAALGVLGIGWFSGIVYSMPVPGVTYTLSGTTEAVTVPPQTKPANVSDMNDPKVTAVMSETTITVPEDGWITSFAQTVHGAPESAMRFSWVYDASQEDPYCEAQQRVVFVMSVEKTTDISFPPGHGYFVKKGTELRLLGGFANFTDYPYEDAQVAIDLAFVPRSSGRELRDAYPLFLNAECTSLFVVPPKKTVKKELHKPFTIPVSGTMTLLASHAHKFAKDMRLTLNGTELWRTTPVYLPDGTNLGNPMYTTPFNGVPVREGDTLDWSVTYVNPLERPTDAMASIYIHIIPDTNVLGRMSH
jgi:hypothetical protein